ncbi:MAG TPA: GTPase Era [Anaerolineae bacterium]|nr:GTPase Era [Anaerolineae bacterium]
MNRSLELQGTLPETPPGFRSGYVAVIGKPNVGKSTLLNTYLGQKISIVSSKPQTTRDRIIGILTQPNAQVVFIDTPGIHQPKHALGQHMIDMAYSANNEADVIVFMVDVTAPPDEDDQRIAQMLHEQPDIRSVILALNKMDHAPSPEKLKQNVEAFWALAKTPDGQQPPAPWDWIMLSASNNRNCTELLEKIIAALPEGPMFYPADQVTDRQERDIAAELIREQALLHLKQEVPHAVAVAIEQYQERPNGSVHITATIYVERDSQKGIMIGSGGQMLKQIGADARHEIQRLIDNKVFLELWVKVRKNWREDESELRKLGYTSNE